MNAHVETLVAQAKTLTPLEQAELLDALYDLVSPSDPEWEGAWSVECGRRLAEYDRGEVAAEDFDVVMARLREEFLPK